MRGKTLWALLVVVPALIGGLVTAAVIITPLPDPNNPEVTEILDVSGKTVDRLFTEDRIEIPVTRMPKDLLNAIVAIEDDRFYRHRGVDPVGIVRAFYHNVRARKVVQGGSTLTMQLARNLSFGGTPLGQKKTVTRKLKEALLAVKLEYKYSKEQILGMYWNSIYLGRRAYGLERAAQTYFGKSVQTVPDNQPLNLTLAESAVLASLPQSPGYLSSEPCGPSEPRKPEGKPDPCKDLLARRNRVLDKMAEQGYASIGAIEAAKQEPVILKPPTRSAEGVPYFRDYVEFEIRERYPEVAARLREGGFRIFTTLDPNLQKAANAAVAAGLLDIKATQQEEPEIALVAMDPSNGYIRALIGGRGGKVDLNRVLEPRQPGSTFKPFVYATALSTRDYVVTSTQIDKPHDYPGRESDEPWIVQNWEGKSSNKPETMRTALQRSLNTVTAAWMDTLKPGPVIKTAKSVGLEAEYPPNLTIGLGTVSVTPLQMTSAFAALANGGYRIKPMAVLKVEDRHGNVYISQEPSRSSAMEPGVAFIVTDMLKEVLRPGGTGSSGGALLKGRPAAGKSGTTNESVDAWFVGYTPDLVAGVWVGYDDRRGTKLLGGQHVSPIWGRFMSAALAGKPPKDWAPPSGVVGQEICTLTGLRPNASCPAKKEWYLKGTVPTEVDSTIHWGQMVPKLPGVPWAPPGGLPPMGTPGGETPPGEELAPPEPGAGPAGPPEETPPGGTPSPPVPSPPGKAPPSSGTSSPDPNEPVIRAPDAPSEPPQETESDPDGDEPEEDSDPADALHMYPSKP